MANDVSTQKLVNELAKAVEESKELLKITDKTNDVFISMANNVKESFTIIDKKTTKGLSDFNKALDATNAILEKQQENNEKKKKINTELTKQEKELIALKKKLAKGLSEEVVENEKLRVQIQEQNKQRKLQVKQSLGLLDAYQQESARLNKLRKEYKNLAVQNKNNTKEAKELLKTITELDEKLKEVDETVGQNQRSVGDYAKAMKGLNSTIGKLGITAVIVKGIELLTGAFGDSRDGALLMEQAMNRVSATISVVIGRVVDSVSSIRDAFRGASITNIFSKFGDAVDILGSAFDGVTDSIDKTIENLDTVTKLTQKYNIEIQALERSVSTLNKSQVLQTQIAENDTLSFETRTNASKEAVKQAIELGRLQEELSRKQLDQQVKTIATQLRAKDVAVDVDNATAEQIITLLKAVDAEGKFTNAKKISSETEQAFTDAFIANQEAQLESGERLADTLEKQNKLYSDRAEIILDIQIDALDNQKSINERIISNDKETFDKRKETLDRTKELFEDGFEAQKKTLIDFNNQIIESERKRIEASTLLTKAQKKEQLIELQRQQDVLTGAEIDKIVAEDNAVIQADKLLELDLNEKSLIRLLSAIRDYRTGVQDLDESEEDYNDTLIKRNELLKEIEAQNKVLQGKQSIQSFEEGQLERDIQAAIKRRDATKANTTERLEAQKELNDLLLEQQKQLAEDEKSLDEKTAADKLKREEEAIQKRKELIETAQEVLEDQLNKASEKRIDRIEKEQEANQARIDQITAAIENGNKEAEESLAKEEKRSAELAAQKEKERKNAIKLEAGLAILKAFGENDGDLGKTIADSTALIAFISSIGSFFEGTEDTGTVAKPLDSNGGRVAILHDNERVLTAKQNAKLGGLSNDDVADLGAMHSKGVENGGVTIQQYNNQEMINGIKGIEKAVKNIPISSYNYDANGKYHVQVLKDNHGTRKLRMKAKNPYTSA